MNRERPWKLVKLLLIIGALLLPSGPWQEARAQPWCDASRPYSALRERFDFIVDARDVEMVTTSDDDGFWTGNLILTRIRFIKWPRGRNRPQRLVVAFSRLAGSDCDWYPRPDRTYVLALEGEQLNVVNSYPESHR
jgi:hypothetical protein